MFGGSFLTFWATTDSEDEKQAGISLQAFPTKVMLVGLQGTGKTTTAAKLALFYKQKGKRVLLVATDLKRPAACEQLQTLAKSIDVPIVLPSSPSENLSAVVAAGLQAGREQGADLIIVDTAGRVQVDETLMGELAEMKSQIAPHEILLVADAMTGQMAVSVAEQFHQSVGITGVVLTKTEGDARGGALLSIRAMTGAPVRFVGVGESVDALEPFYPSRMASRILGMGDILSLVNKVEQAVSLEQAIAAQEKIQSNRFTLEEFKDQLVQMKKMGDFGKILEMIPGMQGMASRIDGNQVQKELKHTEAILSSMTPGERVDPDVIDGNRRKRIAGGSGTSVQDVNRLLKQFYQTKKMLKSVSGGKRGMRGAVSALSGWASSGRRG